VEEVVVTGSRIVRDGYEAPTPLTVVGVEQLQTSGTTNVADYVNTLPAFAGSRNPTTTNSSMSGGSSGANVVNLRNLGLERTLVLLDGQRSVGTNSNGVVDINTFPQNLISRVDVVTGGASAAYGSDALAGVVNFILDKKFTGVKGEISGGVTTYGDNRQWDMNMAAGTAFANGRGHFLISAQAGHTDGIQVNNRPWNLQGYEFITNPAYGTGAGQSTAVPERLLKNHVSTIYPAGSIITNGPLKGITFGPGGVPRQFVYGDVVSGGVMTNGEWQASTIRGTALANGLTSLDTNQNFFSRASYQVTDTFEMFAQASWGHDYNHNWCCPFENNGGLIQKIDNPFIPAAVSARMTALGLTNINLGSMVADLGVAGANNDRRVERMVVGGSGSFEAAETTWTWNAYGQIGVTMAHEQVSDPPHVPNFNRAIDAVTGPNGQIMCRSTLTAPNNGCVPYNLFGTGVNSQAAIRYVLGSGAVDFRNERFVQRVVAASAQGEPFSSWAGPVSVAFGVEHRKESAAGIVDLDGQAGNWDYGNYRPLNASTNVSEGFVETIIPLAKGTEWAKSLDLNAAGRFTSYKTSGFVATYKFGLTYDPIDDVRFRVTRSHDIRAPNLIELFSGGGGGFPGYINPFKGNASEIGRSSTSGNATLVPEVSDMTGLGVVLNPQFFPGFNASVDYWNMDISKAIGNLTVQQIIDQCYAGNAQMCAALVFNADGSKTIDLINIRPFNLVSQLARGIDFEVSYRTPLDAISSDLSGNLMLRFLATNFLRNYSSNGITIPFEGAGVNNGGLNNTVPNWKWNASATYSTEVINFNLGVRGVSGGVYNNSNVQCTSACPVSTGNNRTVDTNHIDGAVYFDTAVSYKIMVGEASSSELFFNVRNLTNKAPAIVAPGPGGFTYEQAPYNGALYDALGRTFRAGVRFKM
jgi:iron complex outermembrane receptor protein